jgi:hypothetical protein
MPKAMRCRPSETLWMPLKRRMLAANERRRAKMPGLQRMRLASSAKLPSRTVRAILDVPVATDGFGTLSGWQHDVADAGIAP